MWVFITIGTSRKEEKSKRRTMQCHSGVEESVLMLLIEVTSVTEIILAF